MDYFGWSIWTGLFTGDIGWLNGHNIPNPQDFEPDADGWTFLFNKLDYALEEAGLKGKLGTCFHTSIEVPRLLQEYDFLDDFYATTDKYMAKPDVNFDFGLHASFSKGDYILNGKFAEVLKHDLEMRKILKYGNTIVEHPAHPVKVGRNKAMVEKLTTEPIISMLEENDVLLCWENMPGYASEKCYYSSIKHLLEFREELGDKFQDLGKKHLIEKNLFCFDTGHLLIWRHQQQDLAAADKEIEEYLPEFAKLTKVFHYHANDGVSDNHMAPSAWAFAEHPSRKWVNKNRFLENSERVYDWIELCEGNKGMDGRHLHLEAGTYPFSVDGYIEFGKRLADLI